MKNTVFIRKRLWHAILLVILALTEAQSVFAARGGGRGGGGGRSGGGMSRSSAGRSGGGRSFGISRSSGSRSGSGSGRSVTRSSRQSSGGSRRSAERASRQSLIQSRSNRQSQRSQIQAQRKAARASTIQPSRKSRASTTTTTSQARAAVAGVAAAGATAGAVAATSRRSALRGTQAARAGKQGLRGQRAGIGNGLRSGRARRGLSGRSRGYARRYRNRYRNSYIARNFGLFAAGTVLGLSLGLSPWYFADPFYYSSYWGPYSTFSFGWGVGYFYPRYGFWYHPWWRSWYYPWFNSWYFPYDYSWYYPTHGYYVRLYPNEAEPYVALNNDEADSLFFGVYEQQTAADGSTIFYQVESPQKIQRGTPSKLYFKQRDPGEIIIISNNQSDLALQLSQDEASQLSVVQLDEIKKQSTDSGTPPSDALRIDSLDAETKQKLKEASESFMEQDIDNVTEDDEQSSSIPAA